MSTKDLFGTLSMCDTLAPISQGIAAVMGMIKLFIFLVLAYIAFVFWRQMKTIKAEKRRGASPQHPPKMVRCAQCQLHLPEHLALRQGDKWYCCSEHRDVDQQS